jgi:hypothetical protein
MNIGTFLGPSSQIYGQVEKHPCQIEASRGDTGLAPKLHAHVRRKEIRKSSLACTT